jgi:RNA polymerase sigma-70 factor (ECF subfamily)
VSSFRDLVVVGKMFDEYRSRLLAVVRRRLPAKLLARIDPEDILSEAYLVARRKYPMFVRTQALSPYAWLYRIVLDCVIAAWRRETRDRRNPAQEMPWPEQSSVQLGLRLIDTGTSPSLAAARRELTDRMRRVVAMLKAGDQQVLWMRHSDQLSFKEMGMVLGLSESAATLRYRRALKRLKDLWTQVARKDG